MAIIQQLVVNITKQHLNLLQRAHPFLFDQFHAPDQYSHSPLKHHKPIFNWFRFALRQTSFVWQYLLMLLRSFYNKKIYSNYNDIYNIKTINAQTQSINS